MHTYILVKTAFNTIIHHAGRSLLTILGIMIGIAAIIITFSIGRGAEEKIRAQVMFMGEGACYIIPGNVITKGAVRSTLSKPMRLIQGDLEAIARQVSGIREVSRGTYTLETLEYGSTAIRERMLGTDENLLRIIKNKLKYGKFFSKQQLMLRTNVVVIGDKIQEKLFGTTYSIGKTIRINGIPFEVIGVIEHQEHFFGGDDPNARSFVPFTVAKKYFRQPNEMEDDIGAILIGLYENISSDEPMRKIRRILRMRHNIEEQEDDDFTFLDQESITRAAQSAASVIKLFGLIAASISLLVGGIGIMNIMLVSVKERTQEIGLRIALGSTKAIVQLQFLFEAIALCGIGGIIGIVLGLIGQQVISTFTNLPSILEIMPLFVSFLVTIVIGIIFGFFPARQASLLNPIDALLER
jgi:putative ABC transport system permease protein